MGTFQVLMLAPTMRIWKFLKDPGITNAEPEGQFWTTHVFCLASRELNKNIFEIRKYRQPMLKPISQTAPSLAPPGSQYLLGHASKWVFDHYISPPLYFTEIQKGQVTCLETQSKCVTGSGVKPGQGCPPASARGIHSS